MQGLMVRIAVGVFGLLTVAIVLLGVFNDRGLLSVRAQQQKLESIQSEVSNISGQNDALKEEIDALRNDPATIERIAREKLKLVKPGEVVLVEPETPSKPAAPSN